MTGPDHLAHLAADAAATSDVLRTVDPGAPVAACPGWALRDLALHLGQIHRWASAVVRTGEWQRPPEVDVADGAERPVVDAQRIDVEDERLLDLGARRDGRQPRHRFLIGCHVLGHLLFFS